MNKPTEHVWVTRDGREVPVRLMTDRHLVNAIKYLVRNAARIKQAAVDQLEELHCTLDELDVDLNDLPVERDADSPLQRALLRVRSIDEIGDLAECVELMSGDEVPRAVVVTWPMLVLEARRRGLIGSERAALMTGAPQLPGDVDTKSGTLKRVETRVEPTRKGWR